jgi:hypothetical protein
MDQGCSSLCGVITSWTVPRMDREGCTSVLSLRFDDGLPFSLSVTLQSLEDHTWYNGQHVIARDVAFDSFLKGRTNACVPIEEKGIFSGTFSLWTCLLIRSRGSNAKRAARCCFVWKTASLSFVRTRTR